MSAPRRSLKDLAKLASTSSIPPQSSVRETTAESGREHEDSGVIDLKATLGLDAPPASVPMPVSMPAPTSQSLLAGPASMPAPVGAAPMAAPSIPASALSMPPSVPSFAPSSRSLDSLAPPASGSIPAAIPSGPLSSPMSAPAASIPAPVSSAAVAAPYAAADSGGQKKGGGLVLLLGGGLIAAAAVAAGAFMYVRSQNKTEQPVAMVDAPKADTQPTPAKPGGDKPSTDVGEPSKPTDAVDPTTLPGKPVGNAKTLAVAPKPGAAGPVATASDPKTVDPKEAKKEPAKDPAPTGSSGTLSDEMRKAAGTSSDNSSGNGNQGPQFAPGSVPQKPSQGALTSALSAVLPAARACVASDDPVSRATVTFASGGNVQSVSVSGPATTSGCIKSALMGAKVSPFAESSFTTSVTIRH
ncbi:MAG: hypothetical protein HOO96_23940 [Polyangiaceae bacterium]|nr:hypothetical protein [Polyangiaceae bacterium]